MTRYLQCNMEYVDIYYPVAQLINLGELKQVKFPTHLLNFMKDAFPNLEGINDEHCKEDEGYKLSPLCRLFSTLSLY